VASLGGDVSYMTPPHVAEALQKKFKDLKAKGATSSYVMSIKD
jgi:hypothetical protein